MNVQEPTTFFMPGDDPRPVLLSAVTILDRATLRQLDAESLARLWHDIHAGTRARLTTSVARFYLDHHDVTIHDEPASCALAWDGDDNAVGYVLSAMAYKHVDLSHALADVEDHREGEWIRLHTKCGCESRSMRYPAPLPLTIHKSVAGGGVRTFRKGAVNTFGATTYHEVT